MLKKLHLKIPLRIQEKKKIKKKIVRLVNLRKLRLHQKILLKSTEFSTSCRPLRTTAKSCPCTLSK